MTVKVFVFDIKVYSYVAEMLYGCVFDQWTLKLPTSIIYLKINLSAFIATLHFWNLFLTGSYKILPDELLFFIDFSILYLLEMI